MGFCKSEVNNLKKFMRFNWNFQKGRVVFEKFPSMGKVHYGYFLELHTRAGQYVKSIFVFF